MKKIVFVAMVLMFASCGSQDENPSTPEDIKKQISEYKKQVVELNEKISALEKELVSEDDEMRTSILVAVQEMHPKEFDHYIHVNGSVEAVNDAFISPEINGQVDKIHVQEGQYVRKGNLLIEINSSITESSIDEVEKSLELARIVYEKQKQLWDKNIGSEIEYLQAKNNVESLETKLETLQAQLNMAKIKAPISGIVDEIMVKEGEFAIPGIQVIQLVNLSEMFVNADVAEAYLTKVKARDTVLLEFPTFPDYKEKVPVYRVGNTVKQANRTFTVQLKIPNKNGNIKPNLVAVVRINDYRKNDAMVVPSIIIKNDIVGSYVYVAENIDGKLTARKRYITTGLSYQDMTLIESGLEPGEQVVVKGYNQVSDGVGIRLNRS